MTRLLVLLGLVGRWRTVALFALFFIGIPAGFALLVWLGATVEDFMRAHFGRPQWLPWVNGALLVVIWMYLAWSWATGRL